MWQAKQVRNALDSYSRDYAGCMPLVVDAYHSIHIYAETHDVIAHDVLNNRHGNHFCDCEAEEFFAFLRKQSHNNFLLERQPL